MKIHYNSYDEFKTSYFSIFPDGSIENMSLEVVGNLLSNDIVEILKIKQKELTHHVLRNEFYN